MLNKQVKIIAFDADDTLWKNEAFFREAEQQFYQILKPYNVADKIESQLFAAELKNLPLYGYGIKGFMLSMIEVATALSHHHIAPELIQSILNIGQEMLQKPVELLPGVTETLAALQKDYRLIVATKGDLLDQERKIEQSGLSAYFDHIEIMSDKKPHNYRQLLNKIDCQPDAFLMIGNSIKSDIAPVLDIGGFAVHIPYHITWAHEQYTAPLSSSRHLELTRINQLITHLIPS